MLIQLINKLKKIILGEDSLHFYSKYDGGREYGLLGYIYLMIRKFKQVRLYILYHSNNAIISTFGKAKKYKNRIQLTDFENRILDQLNQNGVAVIDSYFSDIIDDILKENYVNLSPVNSYYLNLDLVMSDAIIKILNDSSMKRIASSYYNAQAYYRYRPHLYNTFPNRNDITSTERFNQKLDEKDIYDGKGPKFSDEWHIDSVYNLQYHILLNDITSKDTRMLFAKGNPANFINGTIASNEYVMDNFEIFELIGNKGTVFFLDGSLHWHRLFPVCNSLRQTISVLFSKGQKLYDNKLYKNQLPIKKLNKETLMYAKYL